MPIATSVQADNLIQSIGLYLDAAIKFHRECEVLHPLSSNTIPGQVQLRQTGVSRETGA